MIIAQRKNGLKYYYKNREKKLAYSRTYADTHKEEKAIWSKEYFKDPEKKERRRLYMKSYHKRKQASKK